MCGIAGLHHREPRPLDGDVLRSMTRSLLHRGPDEEGYYLEPGIGMGQRRLSIIDLAGGRQPIHNEDQSVWTVFNGEIFNYLELRADLEKKGHRFYTHTDTEVIVHAYEEYGEDFTSHLNGQFAIAVWDVPKRRLTLARDRVGIRPLYYAETRDGTLAFASEMKALFRHPDLSAAIDPVGIGQIFTFWVNVPPRTVFQGVKELPPGHLLVASPEGIRVRPYWKLTFPDAGSYEDKPFEHWVEGLRHLLFDSTTLQLRADVPVAAYLSGGIDSSIISALVKKHHNHGLITFSVAFQDADYDERPYQKEMVDYLRTDHRMIEVGYADIGACFSDTVRFAEKPMIRTASAPLLLLARLVRRNGVKVVLTGEGADELFGGYNIFQEDIIRRFWARQPDSKWRPSLLSRLYPEFNKNSGAQAMWRMFFKKGLADTANPYYSHQIRWSNTAQIKSLFTPEFRKAMGTEEEALEELSGYLDPDMPRWHPLARAQYLETVLFMSGYLLSSQGDRMMMGASIEGRFPFLDHRLVEFAATIPPRHKIRHLREKHVLREAFKDLIPDSIANRPKQPYRAPIFRSFLDGHGLASEMLTPEATARCGFFDPAAVAQLVSKFRRNETSRASAREDMAMVGIVSTHLLHHHFLDAGASGSAA